MLSFRLDSQPHVRVMFWETQTATAAGVAAMSRLPARRLTNMLLSALEQRKWAAWQRATPIIGYDANIWRRDDYGWTIRWSDHGDRQSEFGWEIDHVVPLSRGGADTFSNLRALHWRNNASRGGALAG